MAKLNNIIKESYREQSLPDGHLERFNAKLNSVFETKIEQKLDMTLENREQRVKRILSANSPQPLFTKKTAIISSLSGVALLIILLSISILVKPTQTQVEMQLAETEQMLEQAEATIESMQEELLAMAKERLPYNEYKEIENSIAQMRFEYMELKEMASEIPNTRYIKLMASSNRHRGDVTKRLIKQIAVVTK